MLEPKEEALVPDPLLGAALRWVEGEPHLEEVDWAMMRSNIRGRAELPLARRRALRLASPRWMRAVVPLATAAGIAALLWAGVLSSGETPARPAVAAAGPSIREAILSDLPDQEFRTLVSERNDANELLLIAANQH